MPDRMPDWMPEDMSDRVPEDMPDRMAEDLPDRMPEDLPEDMPDHMPEDMPDRMPNRMSEDMSDRMPEDLPVRKCINVMVGITRSKVIIFYSFFLIIHTRARVCAKWIMYPCLNIWMLSKQSLTFRSKCKQYIVHCAYDKLAWVQSVSPRVPTACCDSARGVDWVVYRPRRSKKLKAS